MHSQSGSLVGIYVDLSYHPMLHCKTKGDIELDALGFFFLKACFYETILRFKPILMRCADYHCKDF